MTGNPNPTERHAAPLPETQEAVEVVPDDLDDAEADTENASDLGDVRILARVSLAFFAAGTIAWMARESIPSADAREASPFEALALSCFCGAAVLGVWVVFKGERHKRQSKNTPPNASK